MAAGTAKKIQKELCILYFAAPIILKGTSLQPSTHSGIIWANLAIMIRSPMYDRLNVGFTQDAFEGYCQRNLC